MAGTAKEDFALTCEDGVAICGTEWRSTGSPSRGVVIVNPATGVLARYYHRYAIFLADHGFHVLTFDYRGIGRSRPSQLQGCRFRWRDWGEYDFDAVLKMALAKGEPVHVVGHSIGGFLPGFSRHASHIARILTVGAQYAFWRDYADGHRMRLFLKWHVVMPVLTAAFGYFPGRRLGWLEDLPRGVANEWSFRRARMEASYPRDERAEILRRFRAVKASILAIGVSDDDIAPARAIARALAYYESADRDQIMISPQELGCRAIGHFGLFHDRFRTTFWTRTVDWLAGNQSYSPRRR